MLVENWNRFFREIFWLLAFMLAQPQTHLFIWSTLWMVGDCSLAHFVSNKIAIQKLFGEKQFPWKIIMALILLYMDVCPRSRCISPKNRRNIFTKSNVNFPPMKNGRRHINQFENRFSMCENCCLRMFMLPFNSVVRRLLSVSISIYIDVWWLCSMHTRATSNWVSFAIGDRIDSITKKLYSVENISRNSLFVARMAEYD